MYLVSSCSLQSIVSKTMWKNAEACSEREVVTCDVVHGLASGLERPINFSRTIGRMRGILKKEEVQDFETWYLIHGI